MNTKNVANKLITLRQSQKWSQEVLAEKLHVSRQAISKWETANSLPNLDYLLKLSHLYQLTINEILEPGNSIVEFEDIVTIDKRILRKISSIFSTSDIVKASMGASPEVNELFRQLFKEINFIEERNIIGTIKINEIEAIQNQILSMINMELGA